MRPPSLYLSKVSQLDSATVGDEDVAGSHIHVDKALGMQVRKCAGHLVAQKEVLARCQLHLELQCALCRWEEKACGEGRVDECV